MTNTAEEINKIPDQRIIDLADAILPALESGTFTIKEKALEIAIFVLQAGYLPSPSVVSPLVWKAPDRPISYYDFYAETPIGTIYIKQVHETSWSTWLRDRFQLTGGLTLEEAKQAAQNHFTTIIGSCLQGGGEKSTEDSAKKWLDKITDELRRKNRKITTESGFIHYSDIPKLLHDYAVIHTVGGGYTEELVVGFAEWLDDNDIRQQTEVSTGKTIFGIWEDLNGKRFATKELFTLYLTALKQQ